MSMHEFRQRLRFLSTGNIHHAVDLCADAVESRSLRLIVMQANKQLVQWSRRLVVSPQPPFFFFLPVCAGAQFNVSHRSTYDQSLSGSQSNVRPRSGVRLDIVNEETPSTRQRQAKTFPQLFAEKGNKPWLETIGLRRWLKSCESASSSTCVEKNELVENGGKKDVGEHSLIQLHSTHISSEWSLFLMECMRQRRKRKLMPVSFNRTLSRLL